MAPLIRVLDEVPELAEHLRRDELVAARRAAVAVAQRVDRGPWEPDGLLNTAMGAIVGDGLLVRRSSFGETTATVLLGPGDLLVAPLTHESLRTTWHVLQPTRVMWLGPTFERATHAWPALGRSMVRLVQEGNERGVALLAIAQLQRIEDRLLALLWHFGERWGRVTPHGVALGLRLQHRLLAELIGARRPSVTTALGRLAAEGRIVRRAEGGWLLRGALPAPAEARELVALPT